VANTHEVRDRYPETVQSMLCAVSCLCGTYCTYAHEVNKADHVSAFFFSYFLPSTKDYDIS